MKCDLEFFCTLSMEELFIFCIIYIFKIVMLTGKNVILLRATIMKFFLFQNVYPRLATRKAALCITSLVSMQKPALKLGQNGRQEANQYSRRWSLIPIPLVSIYVIRVFFACHKVLCTNSIHKY